MTEQMVLKSKKKWFWIGAVLSVFLPPFIGLILGVSLFTEKPYRKEATIIIAWTIVWTLFLIWFVHYILAPGLHAQLHMPIPVQK